MATAAPQTRSKVVLVHGGARDAYQVAQALAEADLLDTLVTDLFWPSDRPWARALSARLPAGIQALLRARSAPAVPSARVQNCVVAGLKALLLDRARRIPFSWRREAIRSADRTLGRTAGRLAKQHQAGLLTYSYVGYEALKTYPGPGILFQVHPHPLTIRRLLSEELQLHPDCAGSLQQEWELALPEQDFDRLVEEPRMAARFLCASSFTRQSLVDNGAPPTSIQVIPYGVDSTDFHPDPQQQNSSNGKLKLLFVGRINQRKGIKYLLEALRLLKTQEVELTICGRVIDGLDLFAPFADRVHIRPSVSPAELRVAYQSADLFVFPSVAEGFGQVLLEAMASGLPVLSTTNTAAPDLITEGVEGFVVPPRRPDLIAERIDWAATHRKELRNMGAAARQRAEHFTTARFRRGIAAATRGFLQELQDVSRPMNRASKQASK